MNNNKTVFFAIGALLIVLGVFMVVPLFVQFIYKEGSYVFLSSATVTIFIGILLVLTNLQENRKLNLQQAILLTTLAWLSIAIFGCIPFLLSDINSRLVNLFIELRDDPEGLFNKTQDLINSHSEKQYYEIVK